MNKYSVIYRDSRGNVCKVELIGYDESAVRNEFYRRFDGRLISIDWLQYENNGVVTK